MAKKKTKPQEAAATAKFTATKQTTAQLVDETKKKISYVQANPAYAATPAMQQAVTTWEGSMQKLDKNNSDAKSARVSLDALIAARPAALAEWRRATKAMVSVVDQVSVGSAQAIKDWGFDVVTRTTTTPTSDPPQGLRVTYDKAFELNVRWKGVKSHVGYQIQIGDGTPTGWGGAIVVAQAHYKPVGLVPGQHLAIRVAVQRKTGLSTWSDVLTATVR